MSKYKPVRGSRKRVAKPKRKRPIVNFLRAVWRVVSRVPWPAWVLCAAAFAALVIVEKSLVEVIFRMAPDPITGAIFGSAQVLASLGVIIGPLAARSIRAHGQRSLAWKVVIACFVLSVWNLSTVLANATSQQVADAIRAAPTFEADQARLSRLNANIDALADESNYAAQETLANYTAERDRLAEKLDGATPEIVLFAWENDGWAYWAKALIFHALVAGFSSAFAMQMASKRKPRQNRRSAKQEDFGNVEPLFGRA